MQSVRSPLLTEIQLCQDTAQSSRYISLNKETDGFPYIIVYTFAYI